MTTLDRVPRDLLLEIGTEEIPARFFASLLGRLREEGDRLLKSEGLSFGALEVFGTPRRLILRVRDLAPLQADRTEEVLGPPRKAAFDSQGKPTAAANGFARSQGVAVEALEIKTTEKGEYLCVTRREAGRPTVEVLPGLLVRFLSQIAFPKAMRWNATQARFARPIRWILALYGKETIPFEFAGIASGNRSRGHRFLSSGPYAIGEVSEYDRACESHFVLFDPEKRRQSIEDQLNREVEARGGSLVPDSSLLDEVVFLTEYPVAVCGSFDPAFLEIPREVLITSMRGHQKCFSIERDGKLLPYFIGISNIQSPAMEGIRTGYERVLRARLSDARFFFENDRKVPLETRGESLRQVIFLEKLGTIHDKVERLRTLSRRVCVAMGWEAAASDAERAARLCKADLLTEMVGEFPELQGIMGREYARREGEPAAVAEAIFEHYLPRNAGDILPATPAGSALALSEKIDNLVGCFFLDKIPSGSNDPYALRRQALGILNILIRQKRRGSLTTLLDAGIGAYGDRIPPERRDGIRDRLLQFIRDRGEGLWQAEGYPYDTIRTVLAEGLDDPHTAGLRISALHRIRREADFEALMVSYRRAINILRTAPVLQGVEVQEGLLKEPEEKGLNQAVSGVEEGVRRAVREGKFEDALKGLASLKGAVDAFFDKVLVMDPDPAVRENRFRLLRRIQALFSLYGDFSQMTVEGKK